MNANRLPAIPRISLVGLESVSGRCRRVAEHGPAPRLVAAVVRLIGARRIVDVGCGRGHTLHAACAAARGSSSLVAIDLPSHDERRAIHDHELATVASAAGFGFDLVHADADCYDIPHYPGVVIVDSDDSIEVPVLRAVESDAEAIIVPGLGRIGRRQRAMESLVGSGYWAAIAGDADSLVAVRRGARWLGGWKL